MCGLSSLYGTDLSINRYLDYEFNKLKSHNVDLIILDGSIIVDDYGYEYCGYFQTNPLAMYLAVSATNNWFPVFVHEASHLDQLIDRYEPYVEYLAVCNAINIANGDGPATDTVGAWIHGRGSDLANISKIISLTKIFELDCECRVLDKIRNYSLPIDVSAYIREANAYIMMYDYVLKHRKWPNSIADDAILEVMPSVFGSTPPVMTMEYEEWLLANN